MMNGTRDIRPLSLQSRLILFCLLLAVWTFCGCSTVQPELTPEERVFNEQLKQQGGSDSPPATADMNTAQKIISYLWWPVLYGLCNALTNAK